MDRCTPSCMNNCKHCTYCSGRSFPCKLQQCIDSRRWAQRRCRKPNYSTRRHRQRHCSRRRDNYRWSHKYCRHHDRRQRPRGMSLVNHKCRHRRSHSQYRKGMSLRLRRHHLRRHHSQHRMGTNQHLSRGYHRQCRRPRHKDNCHRVHKRYHRQHHFQHRHSSRLFPCRHKWNRCPSRCSRHMGTSRCCHKDYHCPHHFQHHLGKNLRHHTSYRRLHHYRNRAGIRPCQHMYCPNLGRCWDRKGRCLHYRRFHQNRRHFLRLRGTGRHRHTGCRRQSHLLHQMGSYQDRGK
mmetsp:Transcript_25944/g.38329  ORF Transcript_25944/g.38329 Transcript_25944/m.38329 type:complete len:291 (+) Transcript_25944:2137-3009(+)